MCIYFAHHGDKEYFIFPRSFWIDVPDTVRLELAIYGEVEDEDYWQEAAKIIQNASGTYKSFLPWSPATRAGNRDA